jgi:hypothetical protein
MRSAALLVLAASALAAQSPCANTPAYSPCEIVFELRTRPPPNIPSLIRPSS